jgi:CelD/BcsL family acetyltransferase involved in cellulose biosynthesis
MSNTTGRIIRDAAELEALAPRWWELWRRCPAATPFQTPAWLLPWWRCFTPGDLVIMAVERGEALVGLAPFYREDRTYGRRLLPLGISLSDYHDVLVDPAEISAAWEVIVELAKQEPGWELWTLEELMPGATALGLPCPSGWQEQVEPQSACPTLALGSIDLATLLPKSKRQDLNLARNRAARRGPVAIAAADAASIGELLEHLLRLHSSRWASRGQAGVLNEEPVRRFHHAAASGLAEAGLLRFYTLAFDKQIVAAYYGFGHRGRAYFYASGFDPAFAFESPGVLVTAHAIEQALREGAREFHFLRGQEAYKYGWGAVDRWNQRRSFRRIGTRHVAA